MSSPAGSLKRATALGLAAVLVASLLGAVHHHGVDHDGATHHIEATHGAHAPTLSETDSRITSGAWRLVLAIAPASTHPMPSARVTRHGVIEATEVGRPPRAPPGAPRTRAPPV